MRGRYFGRRCVKNTKCGQFLRGFKTLWKLTALYRFTLSLKRNSHTILALFWTLSFFHGVHTIHNFQTYDLSFPICLIRKIFIFLITWFKNFLFLIWPFRYHIPIPESNKVTIRRNTCSQNTTKQKETEIYLTHVLSPKYFFIPTDLISFEKEKIYRQSNHLKF